MNEKPDNIIPIEKGKAIKIDAIKTLKAEIKENLSGLNRVLAEASERYKVAQKFRGEEEISRLFDVILDTEASIEQKEKILGEVDKRLHTLIEQSPEKESAIEEGHFAQLTTEQGSVYISLPDGRTQRLETATDELHAPQDVLVFIPSYESIEASVVGHHLEVFKDVENETQFLQVLFDYVYSSEYITSVVDSKRIELKNNQDVRDADQVLLHFINRNNPDNDFFLSVSKEPKLGYSPYDTRVYLDEKGKMMRDQHLGNKIIEIKYQE